MRKRQQKRDRKVLQAATDAEHCAHLFGGCCCVNGYVKLLLSLSARNYHWQDSTMQPNCR